jgi:acetyl-CoA acyltransferase
MQSAFICDAVRTPFGRYGGVLAGIRADDLAALSIQALIGRHSGVDWRELDDVVLGCANQAGEDNRNVARMSLLLAGLPMEVPGTTVNRLCGSSIDAIAVAARAISSRECQLMLAGGVESMSRAPFVMGKAKAPFSRELQIEDTTMGWRFVNPAMRTSFGVDTMPETAENVAAEYRVSRADQDAFALRSQQRNAAAVEDGFFQREIIPLTVQQEKGATLDIAKDEHPRPDTTIDTLTRLKPVVRLDGTVTAGNASGINDGAAVLLIASASAAQKHGLKPRARIVATAAAGVAPRLMGMGPVPAVAKVLRFAGLTMSQMDIIELNEAFAAQALAVLRELGLKDDALHVNPNGGAIAIGHPLGASGARLVTTALNALETVNGRYALCTMCIGVGQGIAMVIERV